MARGSDGIGGRLLRRLLLLTLALGAGVVSDAQEVPGDSLRLLIYGATGRVGSRIMAEALSRGHRVTAVSRDPDRIVQTSSNLSVVQGNVVDSRSVAELVVNQDVVVVSVRGSVGGSRDPEDTVQRVAAEVLVGVLREMGARRRA